MLASGGHHRGSTLLAHANAEHCSLAVRRERRRGRGVVDVVKSPVCPAGIAKYGAEHLRQTNARTMISPSSIRAGIGGRTFRVFVKSLTSDIRTTLTACAETSAWNRFGVHSCAKMIRTRRQAACGSR